jgi:hypothetical protein
LPFFWNISQVFHIKFDGTWKFRLPIPAIMNIKKNGFFFLICGRY